MPEEAELAKKEADKDDEEEKGIGEKMDEDFELGNDFKDQMIPLALEYYLEVIEDESEGECGDCSDDDDDDHHHHGKPGKGKKQ